MAPKTVQGTDPSLWWQKEERHCPSGHLICRTWGSAAVGRGLWAGVGFQHARLAVWPRWCDRPPSPACWVRGSGEGGRHDHCPTTGHGTEQGPPGSSQSLTVVLSHSGSPQRSASGLDAGPLGLWCPPTFRLGTPRPEAGSSLRQEGPAWWKGQTCIPGSASTCPSPQGGGQASSTAWPPPVTPEVSARTLSLMRPPPCSHD